MDECVDFPLSVLASRASARSYSQLSTLLELLPSKDVCARKQLLLHYILHTRHTYARLLTAVRWLKQRHDLVDTALQTEDTALSSVLLFEEIAESLWTSHANLISDSTRKPVVADAADLMVNSPLASQTPTQSKRDDSTHTLKPSLLSSEVSEITHPYTSPGAPPIVPSSIAVSRPSVSPEPPTYSQHQTSSLGSASHLVTERLAIATRNCIRESLLHLGPLRVLSWRSGLADVCVKIGLPNLWSADVSLDSLDPESPLLRIHAISLHLANDVDAPSSKPIALTPVQYATLRRMADDRMSSAMLTARTVTGQALQLSTNCSTSSTTSSVPTSQGCSVAKSTSQSSPSPGSTSTTLLNPICIMLCALQDMMLHDICAPLTMSALRSQARALMLKRWAPFIRVEGAEVGAPRNTPLVIHYWLSDRQPAQVRLTEFRTPRSTPPKAESESHPTDHTQNESNHSARFGNTDMANSRNAIPNAELDHKPLCMSVEHEPPLPSSAAISAPPGLDPGKLNLETLLLSAIRCRIHTRLKALASTLRSRHLRLRLNPSCVKICSYHSQVEDPDGCSTLAEDTRMLPTEHSLHVRFSTNDPVGMEVRILPMTGGIRVRAYGAAAVVLGLRKPKSIGELSSDAKHFGSSSEEADSIVAAFEAIRSRVKLNAAARSLSALDIGVSCTLPPGTASVAATASPEKPASQLVPPFAPLERRAPRRFLTLSPPPPSKDVFASLHGGGGLNGKVRLSSSRGLDRSGPAKRPRLTYATTSDALVFIQESSFAGEDWQVGPRTASKGAANPTSFRSSSETDCIDRYSCTAAAAAAWAVTRDIVERRLRRDSLLRAFVQTGVASAAQMHHMKSSEGGDLHLDSASRVLLKVKCEPLPVRRAELLLRGYDAWQVRLSLLPSIFDSTDPFQNRANNRKRGCSGGNLWSVGVSCTGSQLTFTYPSANTDTVRSFFRDLTRARTAAALARGVPPSRFYKVIRRSPVRIVVGIGPFQSGAGHGANAHARSDRTLSTKPLYTATVEYVYSKGNSGGFSLSFSPSKKTMEDLVPLIEEALDASGGQVGGILAGLLERACPVAAAAESALRERGSGKIRFVTALRVRAVFVGVQKTVVKAKLAPGGGTGGHGKRAVHTEQVLHAVDVDARGGSGLVTVIDVGRATAVMIQQGLAHPAAAAGGVQQRRTDYVSVPRWDDIVAKLPRDGHAEAQRAGSTVVLRMEMLEKFLSDLVTSASHAGA